MKQKLVFIDVDGTLLEDDGIIPPTTITACRQARRQGHLVYLCTGRFMAEITEEILAVGFDGIISAGGAHIEADGKVIFDTVMSADLAKTIFEYFTDRLCGASMEKNNLPVTNSFYLSHWESVLEHLTADGKTNELVSLIVRMARDSLAKNHEESMYEGVNKILFIGNDNTTFADVERAFGKSCEIFRGSVPCCGENSAEISPLGIHKGSALKLIADYHGISIADTIAFGDSDNDRKMLENAGIGIAMGNANLALKEIADDITNSVKDNGIYNGFKKYGLI
jgi:Cof subfamily protein (haloacid dehalogenase superfamily)